MMVYAVEEAGRLLALLFDSSTPAPERAAIGRALADCGDPRPGTGVRSDGLPDIDWVPIPAGPFAFQDDDLLALPAFEIARYPVTAAQYEAFLNAPDGFRKRCWWHDLPTRDYVPDRSSTLYGNHPAENVSWCAAVAFTRWLSAHLDAEIRLPTEQEWEKAARGPDGLRYPWGSHFESDRANLNETAHRAGPYYLEHPVAVGLYPAGASLFGVQDLIGNVWEWCLNTFHDPDDCDLSSDVERVMRGGAWSSTSDVCTTTRDLDLPDFGYAGVGFRLVRACE